MVQVRLYGAARALAEQESVELELPEGATVAELLRRIAPRSWPAPKGIASAILVNGRNCAFREGADTRVADGDLVEILPVVTGG
jgi:molybdopterin converting factor small subunit